jgi:menaquinone-dependent protoporphyrinogen oxidase
MKPFLALYATREGHTRRITEHIAATLRARGFDVDVHNLAELTAPPELGRYTGAILAASVHMGRHERELSDYVKAHRAELESLPTAFLSVSMSEAGAENTAASAAQRAQATASVQQTIDAFFEETGWHPARVKPVAGALLYTQYGLLTRFIMKLIAKHEGVATDTSRDYEYTDWAALDHFVNELVDTIPAS